MLRNICQAMRVVQVKNVVEVFLRECRLFWGLFFLEAQMQCLTAH